MPGAISSSSFAAANPRQDSRLRIVLDDFRFGGPLLAAVAHLLLAGRRPERGERFGSGDVDVRVGKSAIPPMWSVSKCVTTMWRTSSRRKPSRRSGVQRFRWYEHRPGDEADRAHPSGGSAQSCEPEAGVDENQTVVGLDEQHVTDASGRAGEVHRAAVEVVDLHVLRVPTRASSSPRPIWVTRLAESK